MAATINVTSTITTTTTTTTTFSPKWNIFALSRHHSRRLKKWIPLCRTILSTGIRTEHPYDEPVGVWDNADKLARNCPILDPIVIVRPPPVIDDDLDDDIFGTKVDEEDNDIKDLFPELHDHDVEGLFSLVDVILKQDENVVYYIDTEHPNQNHVLSHIANRIDATSIELFDYHFLYGPSRPSPTWILFYRVVLDDYIWMVGVEVLDPYDEEAVTVQLGAGYLVGLHVRVFKPVMPVMGDKSAEVKILVDFIASSLTDLMPPPPPAHTEAHQDLLDELLAGVKREANSQGHHDLLESLVADASTDRHAEMLESLVGECHAAAEVNPHVSLLDSLVNEVTADSVPPAASSAHFSLLESLVYQSDPEGTSFSDDSSWSDNENTLSLSDTGSLNEKNIDSADEHDNNTVLSNMWTQARQSSESFSF
ncbi:hypothetical protein BXZ70DRAFT_704062 [Cristinia sonorae]|uniref:Uncharacterized protein n=1 Tax=Cristinia sonorae TaxID=1940300 RepID=A0A8K0XJS6_9AGAR|nr:hypothetical protein BXZ70DRAFT_704062 [Cristinia sonorae]